jgi:hypothetical protein
MGKAFSVRSKIKEKKMYKNLNLMTTILAVLVLGFSAVAQTNKPSKNDGQKPVTAEIKGDALQNKNLTPDQKAYFAAFEKASKLKEFKNAVKNGDAKLAKRILVANGAASDIVLEVSSPSVSLSDPLPAETPNGGCSSWKLFTWWASIPAPGHYYTTWQCVRWISNSGVLIYDSN